MCDMPFRLLGVGLPVRRAFRRIGVRCHSPVALISFNLSALRARNFRMAGGCDACPAWAFVLLGQFFSNFYALRARNFRLT